jgi:teichuronic acid biosynthesis glycosyltransferase TuaC
MRPSDVSVADPVARGRLRVLMVTAMYPTPTSPHSGTFVKSQVDSLLAVGVDATVLHLRGRSFTKYVVGIWQAVRLAHSGKFDLVHGHYGYCGMVARAQRRLPVVVSFCGDDLLGTPGRDGRPTRISRWVVAANCVLARLVDGVIVKSAEMGAVLDARRLKAPIEVVPNGVDMTLFRPLERVKARQRLGLDPAPRYAVFPADPAIPRKAYPVVAAAIDELRAAGVLIDLVAVHDRPQKDVVDFYNAADVVVLPSLWEGSPNVVKEAMACSVPIVAADVGDVRGLLGQTPGCAIVDRTPHAFASAIQAALELPDGRTNGRAAVSHLSVESVAAQVRGIYDTAMQRARRTRPWAQAPA